MKKVFFRTFAYFIDIIILGIILTCVVSVIPVFNNKKTEELNKEYTSVFSEYVDINKNYDKYLEDKIINDEEFNEIKEKYPNISGNIEKYVNNEVEKEKFNEELFDYAKKFAIESDYKTNKLNLGRYITEFALTIIYFGVIQFVLKGQTIGKKIFKLFVVDEKDSVPSLKVLLIRSIFTSTIVFSLLNSILALTLNLKTYSSLYTYITGASSFYLVFMYAVVVFREDGKGLHDMLLKTHIKMLNEEKVEVKEDKEEKEVKTLEYKEKKSKKKNEKDTN